MARIAFLLLVAALLSLTPATAFAQGGTIKLGEPFTAELNQQTKASIHGLCPYGAALPVALKAGQSLYISATVVGAERQIYLAVMDPTGKVLTQQPMASTKSTQLKVDEVNANGVYKILIMSDRIGPFTVRPALSEAEMTAQELRDEIKELEKRLADRKAKLDEIEKGGKVRP